MLLITKDLKKGMFLKNLPQNLSETSSLEPPFNNPLQKPVCIGDIVIFENVTDEDLAKPIPTYFVNPTLATKDAPLILLPSNSSISDILNKNQELEEQAKSLEGILLEEQHVGKKARKVKEGNTPVCKECKNLRNEVNTLKEEAILNKNEINALKTKVNSLKNEVTSIKSTVESLKVKEERIQNLITTFFGTVSEKDIELMIIENTAKVACKKLGDLIGVLFQKRYWKDNLTQLKQVLENKQIVASPFQLFSLDELKQGVKLYEYWQTNQKKKNSIAHTVLKVEDIRKDKQHPLHPFLGILQKVLQG